MLVVVLFCATGWLTEPQSLIPPGPHNTMQAMQNALQTLVGPYAKLLAFGKLIPTQSSQAMDTMTPICERSSQTMNVTCSNHHIKD